jgi:hypothetical protein
MGPEMSYVVGYPTLNNYAGLEQSIRSVLSSSVKPNGIIVIDNGGSFVPTVSSVQVIRPRKNLGVSSSWNLLHKIVAGTDRLLISNDDVEYSSDCIEHALNLNTGFAAVNIKDLRGRDYSGWSSFFQSEEVWEKVGDYDENFYPAYYEDNDYCWRMGLQGIKMVRAGGSPGRHVVSATFKNVNEKAQKDWLQSLVAKNKAYYADKWGGLPGQEKFLSPFNEPRAITLEEYFNYSWMINSDINEHLPTLRKYAQPCQHTTELAHTHIQSTIGFLAGAPKTHVRYEHGKRIMDLPSTLAKKVGIEFIVKRQDSLLEDIEPTDLLFIDSFHTYERVKSELEKHSPKVKDYILLHDTEVFGDRGEDGGRGIRSAVEEFLRVGTFRLLENHRHNNGLMVLERVKQ